MGLSLYVKDVVDNKPFSYVPENIPRCHNNYYHPKDIAINEESRKIPAESPTEKSSALPNSNTQSSNTHKLVFDFGCLSVLERLNL